MIFGPSHKVIFGDAVDSFGAEQNGRASDVLRSLRPLVFTGYLQGGILTGSSSSGDNSASDLLEGAGDEGRSSPGTIGTPRGSEDGTTEEVGAEEEKAGGRGAATSSAAERSFDVEKFEREGARGRNSILRRRRIAGSAGEKMVRKKPKTVEKQEGEGRGGGAAAQTVQRESHVGSAKDSVPSRLTGRMSTGKDSVPSRPTGRCDRQNRCPPNESFDRGSNREEGTQHSIVSDDISAISQASGEGLLRGGSVVTADEVEGSFLLQ